MTTPFTVISCIVLCIAYKTFPMHPPWQSTHQESTQNASRNNVERGESFDDSGFPDGGLPHMLAPLLHLDASCYCHGRGIFTFLHSLIMDVEGQRWCFMILEMDLRNSLSIRSCQLRSSSTSTFFGLDVRTCCLKCLKCSSFLGIGCKDIMFEMFEMFFFSWEPFPGDVKSIKEFELTAFFSERFTLGKQVWL